MRDQRIRLYALPHRRRRWPRLLAAALLAVAASAVAVFAVASSGILPHGALAGPGSASPSSLSTLTAAGSDAPLTTSLPTLRPGTFPATDPPGCTNAQPVTELARTDPIRAAALQKSLNKVRAATYVPGVSVAIVWDNGATWAGASGFADVAAGTPVTTGTGFALASISKTFVAAVILQLVGEGRLTLDTSVAPLLPDFGLDPRITVHMLLDHTSGLPDFILTKAADAALGDSNAVWDAAKSWSFVPKYHRVPGTSFDYSNTNYLLLGELIRSVTGHAPSAEIRTRLLWPLRLNHAWFQQDEKPRAPLPASYVLRWYGGAPVAKLIAPAGDIVPFRSVVTATGAAGSMAATALDTARWMDALGSGRVVPPEVVAAMQADEAHTAAVGANLTYGLGISTVRVAGHIAMGHSGRYLGARNVVRYLPDLGLSIAVLTNQSEVDPATIAASMIRAVMATGGDTPLLTVPVCDPNGAQRN
jgi:D-alanyl-D-alanine carboxypeptidase